MSVVLSVLENGWSQIIIAFSPSDDNWKGIALVSSYRRFEKKISSSRLVDCGLMDVSLQQLNQRSEVVGCTFSYD